MHSVVPDNSRKGEIHGGSEENRCNREANNVAIQDKLLLLRY
jgi:hypothetical protein